MAHPTLPRHLAQSTDLIELTKREHQIPAEVPGIHASGEDSTLFLDGILLWRAELGLFWALVYSN